MVTKVAMDADCDSILVIDDEQEEKQDEENNVDNEFRPINDSKVNRYTSKENTSVEPKYDGINQVTIASPNRNDDNDSEDDIQVIDDDDDYENSVRKLITVANKVGKDYNQNKQFEAEYYRTRKSDNPELKMNFVNRGNRNRIADSRTFRGEQNQVNISRDRVPYLAKVNEPTVRSGYEPAGHPPRYVMEDYVPHLVDKNNYRPSRRDVAYRLEAPHEVNINKPETVSIDEFYASVNRYAHHIPPEVSNYDKYRDATINGNALRYIYRPEVISEEEYRRVNRDTNRYNYGPDIALSMHDYNYRQLHGTIYRDNNQVYRSADLDDGYNYGQMNRLVYNQSNRPELALSNDYYRHAMTKRDACSHINQEQRFTNDNCIHRYDSMNKFPYSYAQVDDDYCKMSRHTFRPEIISVDYDRTAMNRHCSNEHRPDLNLDPYQLELSHLNRPHLVDISPFREPMLTRHSYPEGTHGYIPKVSHSNAYRAYNDAHTSDEAILNLCRRSEPINVSNKPTPEMGGSKLRTILSRNYITKPENLQMREKKPRNIEFTDNIRSSDTALNTNKTNMHIKTDKSGVPVRANRSNTVILSTPNVFQKGTSNTIAQRDAIATTNTMQDHYDHRSHAVKKVENHESLIKTKGHEDNEKHERKQSNIVIEEEVRKDNNTRFLVVFFTRVKELVKETFPEFSKSLVREIENLGQLASNGKMKTDIQFICPLYCSVSTYSLPRLDSIDDNKIEKHKNRTEICDVCSCIQKCYKLYKKKYFNLVTEITNEREGNENKGRKRTIVTPLAGSTREHTVVCAPKSTKFEENRCANDLVVEKNLADSKIESNLHKVTLEHNNAEKPDNAISPLVVLNENTMLDSLSILNFNGHGSNINKDSLNDNVQNNDMVIGKSFKNTINENEEIINVLKTTVDKSSPDEAEANLILSLSYNDITYADIISSKLKNKPGRKPDAVFTCHICTCIFTYFTSFLNHMQKEHNINGIDDDIKDEHITRKCPFCGIYSNKKLHNEHVKRAHPEIYTQKGLSEIKLKVDKKRSKKRKFIFTCLVCYKNLKSSEVRRHREKEHKGVNVAKMFTKKLSTLD